MMADSIFPHIKKAVEDFMYDQEGNIPRNKVLTVGSMLLVLGILLSDEAFAAHGSHSSHRSHSSHSSHASHASGGSTHGNSSHSSAPAHSNAPAHTSHSNAGPSLSTLNAMEAPVAGDTVGDMSVVAGIIGVNSIPPDTTPVDMPDGTNTTINTVPDVTTDSSTGE